MSIHSEEWWDNVIIQDLAAFQLREAISTTWKSLFKELEMNVP